MWNVILSPNKLFIRDKNAISRWNMRTSCRRRFIWHDLQVTTRIKPKSVQRAVRRNVILDKCSLINKFKVFIPLSLSWRCRESMWSVNHRQDPCNLRNYKRTRNQLEAEIRRIRGRKKLCTFDLYLHDVFYYSDWNAVIRHHQKFFSMCMSVCVGVVNV